MSPESETDIAEDSYKGDYTAFVSTLKEDQFPRTQTEEIDATEKKISRLSE